MRESNFLDRAPSGDQLFYVPYLLRRNKNFYANIFLGKSNCSVGNTRQIAASATFVAQTLDDKIPVVVGRIPGQVMNLIVF